MFRNVYETQKICNFGSDFPKNNKMTASKLPFILVAITALLGLSCSPHKRITPLPAAIDAKNLTDCTAPASFSSDDFCWDAGNLRVTLYSKLLYDAVDISQMRNGDTLIYESGPVIIREISRTDNGVDVNGGMDNGGQWLVGNGGGTFVAKSWDDHAIYLEVGSAIVPLAKDFVIIDCGLEPRDPIDTIRTNPRAYIESLQESRRQFNSLNTLISIDNGVITEIQRHWIP